MGNSRYAVRISLSQLLRPWLILLGCFLPALGMFLYNRSSILDKYVARTWFTAFIMCTAILTLIYIIGDFADNVGDLMNLDAPLMGTFRFYLSQLPMILNLILPYTLLLGTLWALTKLSSSSEITGMLQSGRSLLRINTPIIIGAVFASIYFGIFGFHWAPNSALYRKLMFSSLSQNKNNHASQSTIYKNDAESRIWYLGNPPGIDSPGNPFRQVRVEQFSAPGKMKYELFADEATWDPASRTWTFRQAIKRNYSQEEPRQLHDVPVFAGQEYQTLKEHYPETPWQLISPNVRVDTQGTPALQELIKSGTTNARYLRSLQTEWHVRIARIFSCIILTFIAIPPPSRSRGAPPCPASALRCSWRQPCCSCMSFSPPWPPQATSPPGWEHGCPTLSTPSSPSAFFKPSWLTEASRNY